MGKIVVKETRLAFPNIWEATHFGGDTKSKPSRSCTLLVTPDSPADKLIKEAIFAVAKEKWKDKWQVVLKKLKEENRICYIDGDRKTNDDGEVLQGFEGMKALSCRSYQEVRVFDSDAVTPLTQESGKLYGGCWVDASVDVWAQDSSQWGRRINCRILGLKFKRDGDAFSGGAPASADDFEPEANTGGASGGFNYDDDIPF